MVFMGFGVIFSGIIIDSAEIAVIGVILGTILNVGAYIVLLTTAMSRNQMAIFQNVPIGGIKRNVFEECKNGEVIDNRIVLCDHFIFNYNQFGKVRGWRRDLIEDVQEDSKNIILRVKTFSLKMDFSFDQSINNSIPVYGKSKTYKIAKAGNERLYGIISNWVNSYQREDPVISEDNSVNRFPFVKGEPLSLKFKLILVVCAVVALSLAAFRIFSTFNDESSGRTVTKFNTEDKYYDYTFEEYLEYLREKSDSRYLDYIVLANEDKEVRLSFDIVKISSEENGYNLYVSNDTPYGLTAEFILYDSSGKQIDDVILNFLKPNDYITYYFNAENDDIDVDVKNEYYFKSTYEEVDFDYYAYWSYLDGKYFIGYLLSESDLTVDNVTKIAKNVYSYNDIMYEQTDTLYFYEPDVSKEEMEYSEEDLLRDLIDNRVRYIAKVDIDNDLITVFEVIDGVEHSLAEIAME